MANSESLIIWYQTETDAKLAARCAHCNGEGRHVGNDIETAECVYCDGAGWYGIDPNLPVDAEPGSAEKVAMLSARYSSGIPLWDNEDGFNAEAAIRRDAEHEARIPLVQRLAAFRASGKDTDDADMSTTSLSS